MALQPLPQLNEPFDPTNAIAKAYSIKHMDLANKNIESEMSHRAASEDSQNALRNIQMKREEREMQKADAEIREKNLTTQANSFTFLDGQPPEAQKANYADFIKNQSDQYKNSGGKLGLHPSMIVSPELFEEKSTDEKGNPVTKWNSDKFHTYVTAMWDGTNKIKSKTAGKLPPVYKPNPNYGVVKDAKPFLKLNIVLRPDLSSEVVSTEETDMTAEGIKAVEVQAKKTTAEASKSKAATSASKESRVSKEKVSNKSPSGSEMTTIVATSPKTKQPLARDKSGVWWARTEDGKDLRKASMEETEGIEKTATDKEPSIGEKLLAESKKKKLAKKLTDDGTYVQVIYKEGKPLMGKTKDGKWVEVK